MVFGLVFYISAYFSVTDVLPSAVPVHHDDYTNYAAGGSPWTWSWIRPLSTLLIHFLAQIGPDWLIWSVRLLVLIFVFLVWKLICEFYRPVYYWSTLILFAVGSFSTPIIVEYARYTGMITHLLSGCFGLLAVYFLLREVDNSQKSYGVQLSFFFLILSVLAKEDFILLYAVSFVYVVVLLRTGRKRVLGWGIAGLIFCMVLIASAKFMASSNFLGVVDTTSTYYVDMSPVSIAQTVWLYLIGARHPAMTSHGLVVAGCFVFSASAVVVLYVCRRSVPSAAYFVVATLSIIAPYSLLPNHVNAYYELLWLPMLIASCLMAMIELLRMFTRISPKWRAGGALFALVLLVGALMVIDYPGRKSVAAWYDSVSAINDNTIKLLYSQKDHINSVQNVCISGANSFSPWYMHNGKYLSYVIGIHAKWHIIIDLSSPLYAGMRAGANASNGQTILVSGAELPSVQCLHINLEEATRL